MMILTNYLIDVLSKLSCLVGCMAILIGMAALFSALGESLTSKPSKAKLVFCVVIFAIAPDEEGLRG